jgi:hypothetical protein
MAGTAHTHDQAELVLLARDRGKVSAHMVSAHGLPATAHGYHSEAHRELHAAAENPREAAILAGMAVTGDEKLTFARRLATDRDEAARVLTEVAGGATYIVARTNTIVNSRRPDPFEPAAVILPCELYRELCEAAGQGMRPAPEGEVR